MTKGVVDGTVPVRIPEWLATMCLEIGRRRDSKNKETIGEVLARHAGRGVAAEHKKLPPVKAPANMGG